MNLAATWLARGTRAAINLAVQFQFGLLVGFAAALVTARAAQPPGPTEIPFQFREGFIWVTARVSQSSDPLNFLLDSGAGVSAINFRSAEKLKLALGAPVAVQGVDSTTTGRWTQCLSATTGGVSLPKKFLAVDLSQLSEACLCRVDGLIGADFFRDRIVQIDFRAQRIRLLPSSSGLETETTLPLKLRHGAWLTALSVNGHRPQWARLDTGCAAALHWTKPAPHASQGAVRTAVALAPVQVRVAESSVKMGALDFAAVPTELHEKPIFAGEAGLLGNGLLSRFPAVTIDARAGQLFLHAKL